MKVIYDKILGALRAEYGTQSGGRMVYDPILKAERTEYGTLKRMSVIFDPILGKHRADFSSTSKGWSPASIPGLSTWYRSDLGITMGTGVKIWADQSGGGHDLVQNTGTLQPALITNQLNGFSALRFDGVDDCMQTLLFTYGPPATIFAVFKVRAYANMTSIYDGSVTFTGTLRMQPASPSVVTYAGVNLFDATNLPLAAYTLSTVIFNGASSVIQFGNVAQTTGDTGANPIGGFTLGSRTDFVDNSQIDVVEIIITNTAASTTDRNNVKAYILARYGI